MSEGKQETLAAVKAPGYVPDVVWQNPYSRERWLIFRAPVEATYDRYKELPELLKYEDRLYRRAGYNSDNGTAHYKEVSSESIAYKCVYEDE